MTASVDVQDAVDKYNYTKTITNQRSLTDIKNIFYFKTKQASVNKYTASRVPIETMDIGILAAPTGGFKSNIISTPLRYNNLTETYNDGSSIQQYDIKHSYTFDGTDIYHVIDITPKNIIKSGCFPLDAIATTPSGKKRCEDLVIGEHVLVDHKGTFEPILFFGHRENYETAFVELTLANGNKMSATPLHYIFSYNNKKKTLIAIQDVKMGDFVKYNGKRVKVSEIAMVRKKGFVSPMTKSCEMVIDGVQASCCTDKYTLAVLKPLVDAVDALGITVPLQVVDPIRDLGNAAIKKFNL